MPLELQQAVPEDALRVVEIERLAYKDDPLTPILFPGPFPDDAQEGRAKHMAEQLKDPTTRWMKVVDSESGELIAFSHWHIYKPGCNIAACEDFWGSIYAFCQKHTGDRPHVYVEGLLTDPKHQRKGAGRMLMDWGLKIADELKLPAYLESSPHGHKLYQNCGFKDIDTSVFDKSKYGSEGTYTIWYMERPVPSQ